MVAFAGSDVVLMEMASGGRLARDAAEATSA